MPDTGMMPMTREELNARGIDVPDFVYVIGDAYVDHPSFGAAIISRVLEAKGFPLPSCPSRTGAVTRISPGSADPGLDFW